MSFLNEILSILDIETDLENNFRKSTSGQLFKIEKGQFELDYFSVGISNLKGIPVDLRYEKINFSRED